VVPSAIRADVRSIRVDILRAIQTLENQRRQPTAAAVASRIGCHRNTFDNHIGYLSREHLVNVTAGSGTRPTLYSVTLAGQKAIQDHV
jgi:predicted ArsR family transcriptional regulator